MVPLASLGLSSARFGQGPPPDPAPLPQDQGEGSGHGSPERGQEGSDPVEPIEEQFYEEQDSSDVNPRRHVRTESQIADLIAREVQSALARSEVRSSDYIQEVREHMQLQDQRMATLEFQSTLNAG